MASRLSISTRAVSSEIRFDPKFVKSNVTSQAPTDPARRREKSCEDLLPIFDAYALGLAGKADDELITRHLDDGCDYCSLGLKSARYTVAALAGVLELHDPPERLRTRVLAITTQDFGGSSSRERSRFPRSSGLPFALIAAVLLTLLLLLTPAAG